MRNPRALLDWGRRHEYLAASAFLLGLLCLYFWPLLIGHQLGQSYMLFSELPWLDSRPAGLTEPAANGAVDAALEYGPTLQIARDQLLAGQIPLWNPYSYGGMTLLGNFQTAIAYPLNWIALALRVEWAWGPIAVLKLLTAGLGAYALGRRFSLGRGAGLVGAVIYMLSSPLIVWLQWPLATVFSIFPWLLLATDRLHRKPDARSVGLLAIAAGLAILAGHPESAFLAASAAGVYLLALSVAERSTRAPRAIAARLGRYVLANLLGAGISGIAAVPFLLAYADSITLEAHGVLSASSLPLWSSIVLFLPNVYGDGRPDYFGPPFSYLSVAGYFGVAAILLAGVGLARRGFSPRVIALGVMALVAGMTVFGVPPVSWILETVPPWNTGNNHRVFFVVALAGALGAGAGFEALARQPLRLRSVALWSAALLVFVLGFAFYLRQAGRLGAPAEVDRRAVLFFVLFVAAGTLLLVAAGRLRREWALTLVLLVVVLDLSYLQNWNAVLPPAQAYPARPAAVEAVDRQPGAFRVTGFRRSIRDPLVLPPNTSSLYGLEDVQGYDYPQPRRWADLSWFVLRFRGLTRELNFLTPPPPRGAVLAALRMINTRFYLAPPDTEAPDKAFVAIHRGQDGTVFRDRAALPRAYLVGRTRPLREGSTRSLLARGLLDPRREALVPPEGARLDNPGFRAARTEILSEGHVRVHLPRDAEGGWLVLANSYSPEWTAEVDGRETEISPTNLALMGLPVERGVRTVDFRARSRGFWGGLAVSVLSLCLASMLVLRSRRRTR